MTKESIKILGPWVGLAFAYGGALGSFLSHRDRYLVTVVYEELVKAPKEQIAGIFEKLGLVIGLDKLHTSSDFEILVRESCFYQTSK